MTNGWMLFEISINLYQSIICVYFLKKCVPVENAGKIEDGLCVAACTAFLTLYLFFDIAVTDSLNVIIFFIYLRCVSNKRWYVLALWVVVKEVIVVATVGLMIAACQTLTSATHAMLMEAGVLRVIFVVSTNLVLFLVFFVFSRMMRKNDYPLAVPALIYFLSTNIAVFFSIEMLFSMQVSSLSDTDWHIFAAYGAMIACSILSVLLYHTMTDVVQRENQSQIALNHAQMTRQHQQVLTDIYQDTIARQHDFKHHLQAIEQLVAQGNSEAAKAYLAEYEKKAEGSEAYATGSVAVDALLTAKRLACKQNHIELSLEQYPLSDLPINEVDFCAIVGNMLDNAIEGINRISDPSQPRQIHLKFSRMWDTFMIRCENTMAKETIRRYSAKFLSSKQNDAAVHGFGIRNIEMIAKSANGFCTFEALGNTFIATTTIPYPLREEDAQCVNLQR